jgi:hypothetical protein
MEYIYGVVAILLYFPFTKWTATRESPALAAVIWPLLLVAMPILALFVLFSEKK